MKGKNNRIKCLYFIIPLILCLAFILPFLPKAKTLFQDNNSSYSKKEEDTAKYRLIYSKTYLVSDRTEYLSKEQLIDGYLKDTLLRFEGQDVYFRVEISPYIFSGDLDPNAQLSKEFDEQKKQIIEYVKELGAKDMVLVPDTKYSYYATLNAQMINKIGEAGVCTVHLVNLPRADGYNDKIDDVLVYSLENMKNDQTVDVKFRAEYRYGSGALEKTFAKVNVIEQQITAKEYFNWQTEDYYDGIVTIERAHIEASLTKQQILSLVEEEIIGNFSLVEEDYIAIINVTEDMELPL